MMLPRLRSTAAWVPRDRPRCLARPLAVAGCFLALATGLCAGPVFVCKQTTVEIGMVDAADKPVAEFIIGNTGDAPLEISGVQTACAGCLAVDIPAGPLAPGTTLTLKVTVTKLPISGPVRKLVRFRTNDPLSPEVLLTVNGSVRGACVLTPNPTFALGETEAGKEQTWDYELAMADGEAFAIAAVEAPAGIAVQTALNQPAPRHRLRIATVPADLGVGVLQDLVAVRIDPPAGPLLRFPLSLVVKGPIMPFPSTLLVSIPPEGSDASAMQAFPPRQARLGLLAAVGPCPPVTAVETPAPEVLARVLPAADDARSRTIEIAIQPGAKPGRKGDLIVRLAGEGQPPLRVPVVAVPPAQPAPAAPPPTARAILPFPVLVNRLAQHLGCSPTAVLAGGFADERTQLAVWLAERLCDPAKAERQGRRSSLGGLSVIEYARARDEVTLRLRRDAAFKARCEETLAAVSAEAPAGSGR